MATASHLKAIWGLETSLIHLPDHVRYVRVYQCQVEFSARCKSQLAGWSLTAGDISWNGWPKSNRPWIFNDFHETIGPPKSILVDFFPLLILIAPGGSSGGSGSACSLLLWQWSLRLRVSWRRKSGHFEAPRSNQWDVINLINVLQGGFPSEVGEHNSNNCGSWGI